MKKYRFVFTVLLFSCMAVSLGAETVSLTIDDAVSLALANNLSLKSTAIDLNAAQRSKDTSWNLYLPTISGSISNAGSTEVFSTTANPTLNYNYGLTVGLSASLTLNPAVKEQLESYNVDYTIQQVTYGQARHELERNVKKIILLSPHRSKEH